MSHSFEEMLRDAETQDPSLVEDLKQGFRLTEELKPSGLFPRLRVGPRRQPLCQLEIPKSDGEMVQTLGCQFVPASWRR